MSIYATLWHLQFPRHGDSYAGCECVGVLAQGVPAHIGTPTPGYGYQSGDPYGAFLPPALRIESGTSEDDLRAVVFVECTSKKGTTRSGQEYESPLLVVTGAEYAAMGFQVLHDRLCTALRGTNPRLVLEVFGPGSAAVFVFEDEATASATASRPRVERPLTASSARRSDRA